MKQDKSFVPQNCHTICCEFQDVCKYADIYTDRSYGCTTRDLILANAAKTLGASSPLAMTKIQMLKQLRADTGCSLRDGYDALERSGYNMNMAREYLSHL